MNYRYRKHRATGNPPGRPRIIPHNLDELILEAIKSRADPKTGLAQFSWKKLARHFGVSRSTIWRQMKKLHRLGRLKTIWRTMPNHPEFHISFYLVQ